MEHRYGQFDSINFVSSVCYSILTVTQKCKKRRKQICLIRLSLNSLRRKQPHGCRGSTVNANQRILVIACSETNEQPVSVPYGAHRYLTCHGIIGRSSGDLSTITAAHTLLDTWFLFYLADEPRSIRFVEGHSLPRYLVPITSSVLPQEPLDARFFYSI